VAATGGTPSEITGRWGVDGFFGAGFVFSRHKNGLALGEAVCVLQPENWSGRFRVAMQAGGGQLASKIAFYLRGLVRFVGRAMSGWTTPAIANACAKGLADGLAGLPGVGCATRAG